MSDGTLHLQRVEGIVDQDPRAEWLRLRSQGIGASEAAIILDMNPWKSRYTLACEKIGLIEPDDLSDNEAVEWGNILEDPVARKYVKVTGRMIEDPGRFAIQRHPKLPWMLATLDRVIVPIDDRGPGCLEIKTTSDRHSDDWDEDAPVHYQCQLQHQLAVTGFSWGSLAVLIGGQKFRYIDFERNDNFISFLIEKEQEFWDMIQRGELPEVDASESTKEALERLYPKDRGTTIALPEEMLRWADRRAQLKAAIKAAQAEVTEAENHIKAALGDAAIGLMPDGSGFSYKLTRRAAYTVPASEYRVLREIKK